MFRSKKKRKESLSTSPGTGLLSWTKHFAVFYLIIMTLVCIPFVVLFLVLSIRTILDYALWILPGFLVLLIIAVIQVVRRKKEIRKRLEEEKKDVMELIRTAAEEGHNENISFMHGLIRLDYHGTEDSRRLLGGLMPGGLKGLPATT